MRNIVDESTIGCCMLDIDELKQKCCCNLTIVDLKIL